MVLTCVAVLAGFLVRNLLGSYTVTIPDFLRILGGAQIPGASFIVMESTLPRSLAALLGGAALGAAGAACQSLLRNPLASPDIVGVSMGASAAAVFAITVLRWTGSGVMVLAAAGAFAVTLTVLALGRSVPRIILAGIGLGAALQACVHWMMLRADVYGAHAALAWLVGSLARATWSDLALLGVIVVTGLVVLVSQTRLLEQLELGDDLAAGLGVHVRRTRLVLAALVVVLTATATAVCGPVAFVALLSGPISRGLQGGRLSLPTAAAVGAAITLFADYAAATWLPNLPVGVVTGALGAPFLLWLIARAQLA